MSGSSVRADAGRVAAGMVLLDQDNREAAQSAVKGRRAAVDTGADDAHIGAVAARGHRTTALTAASVAGSAASSASVTGFTGGRRR